ncbi:MAG TPA: hydroxymethylbilane synthase [Burkholderiales bacterium]|jgi:hydroxymethylbilane synthase|nr:hydroxymethylbilane synthase [Burkholderiales bacterium]
MKRVVIATRRSRLALWQAEHVKQRLEALHAGLGVELLPLSTRGDEILDRRLDQAGGKGLFVKELENALAERRADLAVHSMKDVPAELPPGFVLAAVMAREDPRDAFVSNNYENIAQMKAGSVVGTSSLRRAAQIAQRHPHLQMKLLRGNVETRLAKLDRGEHDAIILAVAGLVRLGLAARIRSRLDVDDSVPAPGQGALGIECLDGRSEVVSLLEPLNDPATARCVQAERGVSRALGGSCAVPLGAYAEVTGSGLRLRALVASLDGQRIARADCRGADPAAVAADAVAELRRHGAAEILSALGT